MTGCDVINFLTSIRPWYASQYLLLISWSKWNTQNKSAEFLKSWNYYTSVQVPPEQIREPEQIHCDTWCPNFRLDLAKRQYTVIAILTAVCSILAMWSATATCTCAASQSTLRPTIYWKTSNRIHGRCTTSIYTNSHHVPQSQAYYYLWLQGIFIVSLASFFRISTLHNLKHFGSHYSRVLYRIFQ